ncbi:hypothetical protein Y032_0333g2818 [Ancylostoma ceylanicum]|uniref:Mitochondrial import receptor subunit TOM7 homolog n=1 Tax=Ancylostoma ceylanicum TaxID=53326 RepID=A0A016S031_9BILA|nr:hypothetical protein Y032_0333g2818 [Ancylostoma ceylanicum]
MQLSPAQKHFIGKAVDVSTFAIQWGFVPFVVYLGFRKGPEPLPNGQERTQLLIRHSNVILSFTEANGCCGTMPCHSTRNNEDLQVFVVYNTIEEAVENEEHLTNFGKKYVRFKTSTLIFDVPSDNLLDAKVISRGFRHSGLLALTDESCGAMLNQGPINISFHADDFEKFLFAIALVKHGRDLEVFLPSELCTILKLADYFECPNLMRRVSSEINKNLVGKTPSEICQAFDIQSDFTQPQKQQMKQEGLWYFNTTSK